MDNRIINGINVDLLNTHKLYGKSKEKFAKHLSSFYEISMKEAEQITFEFYESHPELKKTTLKSRWKEEISNNIVVSNKPSAKQKEKELEKKRLTDLDAQGIPYCPKCHSTSLSANKKGFGIGKAVVGGLTGAALAGPVGLLGATAGNIGAKKVRVTCLKCGHEFWAGGK